MYENQEQDVAKIRAAIDKHNQVNRTQGATAAMGPGGDCAKVSAGIYEVGEATKVRYTRADMHEKAAASEQLAAQRNASAASFLRAYPHFEEFLDLIRDGAITLY